MTEKIRTDKNHFMIPPRGSLGSEIRRLQYVIKNNMTENALGEIDKLLQAYPYCAKLWIMRGDLIQVSDDPKPLEDARDAYIKALECDPDNIEAHYELGMWFSVHSPEQYAEATTHVLEAQSLATKHMDHLVGGIENIVHELLLRVSENKQGG